MNSFCNVGGSISLGMVFYVCTSKVVVDGAEWNLDMSQAQMTEI
jgi:hypothetical protein